MEKVVNKEDPETTEKKESGLVTKDRSTALNDLELHMDDWGHEGDLDQLLDENFKSDDEDLQDSSTMAKDILKHFMSGRASTSVNTERGEREITIVLKKAVPGLKVLVIHMPTMGDMMVTDKFPKQAEIERTVALLTRVTKAALTNSIKQITMADMKVITSFLGFFFGG